MKKTHLAAAIVAVSLSLVGCIGDDEEQKSVTESYVGFEPVVPIDEKRGPVIPFPFDALFAGAKTPTLNIPNASNNPLITQANMQDGFSTTASWFVDIFGMVDMATVVSNKQNPLLNNLIIINKATGKPLIYGTDFTVESSTVIDDTTTGLAINKQRTRLLIEPLKPLSPNTTYIVLLKKGVKTLNGGMVAPSYTFKLLNTDTKVTENTDAYLKNYSMAEKATLEALRSQVVRPIVAAFKSLIPENDVLLAYSVTTQSTTKTMEKLASTVMPSEIAAVPIGQTVADILKLSGQTVLPPNADQTNVYVGTLKVPYYNEAPSVEKPTAILSTYWKADATQPDVEDLTQIDKLTKVTPFQIPCAAYATGATVNGIKLEPSVSTTKCFPAPVKQNDQTIPMVVTVPNGTAPDTGWPVVIFQHGITRNRTDVFAVASTFAAAGFVTVSIDLPLHGLPKDNPFYKNSLLAGSPAAMLMTNNERTFDADFINNATGEAGQDKTADGSGTHFINLASPITTRDNLRQGASDILVLAKSLSNLNLTNLSGQPIKINGSQVRYASISLGSIVGTVALGADKSASLIGAASLSVGSGGLPKLLDGSKSYGPIISAGLKAKNVLEGTDSYESFMRFAQTLTDSGDPINFAMNTKMNRPIHFTQVLNDLVVSNDSIKGPTSATQDFVGATGFLSGNNALAKAMGFTDKKEIDITTVNKQNLSGGAWVQMNQGTHGSLINPSAPTGGDPAIFLAVTTELQCQTATFLASGIVPVGCSKPAESK